MVRNSITDLFKRSTGILLAALMVSGSIASASTAPAAATTAATTGGATQSIAEVKELMNAIVYKEYLLNYPDAPFGKDDITIKGGDAVKDLSSVQITTYNNHEGQAGTSILSPDDGYIGYKFSVKTAGFYNIAVTCLPLEGKSATIERTIRIDGKVPFKEARYITFTKTFIDEYLYDESGEIIFKKDINDNEIRPKKVESPEWNTFLMDDSSGFEREPFLFYLSAGEHTISLEAVKEPVIINNIRIYAAPVIPTYEEYTAAQKAAGAKAGTAEIKIQAEKPAATSDVVIYQINDRTSPITQPQDASRIRLNSIGAEKWQMVNQWIRYEIEIPAGGAGLYEITPRFKQAVYAGVYSSRRIKIDGVVPFKEANQLRFNYDDLWQIAPLTDGVMIPGGKKDTEVARAFEFYLSEGKHTIEFQVVLGDMSDLLGRVEECLLRMNTMYRKIRMITGTTPDAYRDYGFEKVIPDVLLGMRDESANLYNISKELEQIIGTKGEHTVILDKIALLLERMGYDTDKIASNLDQMKSNIGALGTWLLERRNQPLQLDYILIQPSGTKLPPAEANFFESFAHEIGAFLMSFFVDYTTVGAMTKAEKDEKVVQVWIDTGRDQATIIRQMIDDDFMAKTGIRANLKLVAGGSLLPATLAGTGPEVAMSQGASTAINYAIRGAVLPLNEHTGDASKQIDSFADAKKRFHPAALVPMTLQNEAVANKEDQQVFGIPENQSFSMLFYRKDILADLDIELPQTWEDLYDIIPILQKKTLDIGFPVGLGGTTLFMYQLNETLYKGDGIAINMDSDKAIEAFKKMINLFIMYKFPLTYDFANRFRTGEMPIGIADYSTYNHLTVFAPEIRGLWEFVPLPGTIREKEASDAGKGYLEVKPGYVLDNDAPAGSSCSIMMRTAQNRDTEDIAWAYMQWWTSADAQSRFGNEMVAILGAAGKQPTANLEALANMSWPTKDFKNLQAQFAHLEATPEVPGSYIVGRYIDFAWKAVYNNGASIVDSLLDYIPEIDKELTRKRKEFGMPTIELNQSGIKIE